MFERRLKTLLVLFTLISVVLVVRAAVIQIVEKSYWETESSRIMEDQTLIPTSRGRILDYKGREIAIDHPCIDVAVDYRAILFDPDPAWMRRLAIERLKTSHAQFLLKPRAKRTELIDAEVEVIRRQIDRMWHTLAKLAGKTDEEMDEQRRQIIRLVETRRRIVWYNRYERALQSKQDSQNNPWYAWLLGEGSQNINIDDFDVTVAEQLQKHVILPDIDYAIRNELAREIEQYPGLELKEGIVRRYPYGSVGCHVIGTLKPVDRNELVDRETQQNQTLQERLRNYRPSDKIGREGLELLLEDRLRGTRGMEISDGTEEVVRRIEPKPGQDVRTSIDIVLTASIEEAFKSVPIRAHNSAPIDWVQIPGAAVVIDIQTAQVRAMVSCPTYDLNQYDQLYPQLSKDLINQPFLNRATRAAIEPGSTVKVLIGLAAMTDGLIGPHDRIECNGYLKLGGQTFTQFARCWTMSQFGVGHHRVPSSNPHPTGFLTFADAIERSCNVYFETLGDRMGVGRIHNWLSQFGLGKITGIGLRESPGRLPEEEDLPSSRRRATAWFAAIGQGQIAATPIQIANVAATIGRNGVWKRPTLLTDGYPNIPYDGPNVRDLHLSPQALVEARRGMINVVQGGAGTGTSAALPPLTIAGKTGSAQPSLLAIPRVSPSGELIRDDKGRTLYEKLKLGTHTSPNPLAPWYRGIGENEDKVNSHAWMMVLAPAEQPKLAIAVMIPYGGGGGLAAGTVVHRILEACVEQGYLPAR